jgi:hypothetical protein
MKRGLSRFTKRMMRRGQVGQTLVILAFGFVVLLGFVGIVTDVSLMFVRYSSLRRAVDAAAVAAAGQMRRAAPTDAELARASAEGGSQQAIERRANNYAYARNVASVSLAARQFIELYGVSPETVLVDTCATTPLDAALECGVDEQPRKLVRVTAQVRSDTIFLRLLGWGSVTLEASAISETAVLDVVMIFDVSESMANQTNYDDWADIGMGMRYMPPRMLSDPAPLNVWTKMQASDPDVGWEEVWGSTLDLTQTQVDGNALYQPRMFIVNANGSVTNVPYNVNAAGQPRPECRVRFFPSAQRFAVPTGTGTYTFDDLRVELTTYMNTVMTIPGSYPANYDGFMGAYNYYGCCNDPTPNNALGNFAFDDLICQPMKQVRDATEDFLNRIDFSRGDRVAFVTFDRTAYLIDPDGTTGGAGTGPQTHMITSQRNALDALRNIVGVRAEPSFYADTDGNGLWDAFRLGNGQAVGYSGPNGLNNTRLGALTDYPVKDNCYFLNAALPYPWSVFASPPDPANPNVGLFAPRFPTALSGRSAPGMTDSFMWPPLNSPLWEGQMPGVAGVAKDVNKANYAYELWGGCRGSNVGAALRVANNALVDPNTIRTNGAVWVMVMLGDGAAAGTDPVRRNGQILNQGNPYNATFNLNPALNAAPAKGDYGAYGLCPYGQPGTRGPLVDDMDGQAWSRQFPYCMDTEPSTRHFCFNPLRQINGSVYIELSDPGCNADFYDADDFARDWADFVGLTDPFPALVTADQLNRTDLQLPTIFTIGFGLDFQNEDGSCQKNISDCLGEELLRYVADVGDNNRIDTDYQQDYRGNGAVDKVLALGDIYGTRGLCEGPVLGGFQSADDVPANQLNLLVNPSPAGESCGNYFNAPDEQELQEVFDTIASRMFTRLTR